MSIQLPNRILELWPSLSSEKQAAILDLVETIARPASPLRLSPDELAALERSKADFAAGRVVDEADYEVEMKRFMTSLKTKSSPKT